MGIETGIAAAAIGAGGSMASSAMSSGGSKSSSSNAPAFTYYPQWLQDVLKERALESPTELTRSITNSARSGLQSQIPGIQKSLESQYAQRTPYGSGLELGALRGLKESEIKSLADIYANAPIQAENIQMGRLAQVVGAQSPMVTSGTTTSGNTNYLASGLSGAASGLNDYYSAKQYNSGIQAALGSLNVSPSYNYTNQPYTNSSGYPYGSSGLSGTVWDYL